VIQLQRSRKVVPLGAAFVIIALAVGVGANAAVFTIVNSVLLRPLPYTDPAQLVSIWEFQDTTNNVPFSGPDFNDLRVRNVVFHDLCAYDNYASFDMAENGHTIHVRAAMVSPSFFRTLGVTPMRGRDFVLQEGQSGSDNVAMLSYEFWQQHFGGQTLAIGKTLELNERPFTIVGIMSREFWFPDMSVDIWTPLSEHPLSLDSEDLTKRDVRWLKLIARLRAGVTIDESREAAASLAGALRTENPVDDRSIGITVLSFRDWVTKDVRRPLAVFQIGASAVLLIISLNISSFMIAKLRRHNEELIAGTATTRCRPHWDSLSGRAFAAAAITFLGALPLAWLGITAFSLISAEILPLAQPITADVGTLILFTALWSLVAVATSLVPIISLTGSGAMVARGSGGRGRRFRIWCGHMPTMLVGSAITVILLTSTGILLRGLHHLTKVGPGFTAEHLLTVQLEFPRSRYGEWSRLEPLLVSLIEGVRKNREVASIAAINYLPFGGLHENEPFDVSDDSFHPPASKTPVAEIRMVSPGYFHTMDIPMLTGRDFSIEEFEHESDVVIISDGTSHLLRDRNVLGRRIRIQGFQNWHQIVGVVGNVKRHALTEKPELYIYLPGSAGGMTSPFLVVRSAGSHELVQARIRRELDALDRDIPMFDSQPMSDRVLRSLALPIVVTALVGSLTLGSSISTGMGVHGFAISSLTQAAINTDPAALPFLAAESGVDYLARKHIVVIVVIGNALGLLGSLLVANAIGGLLHNTSISELVTMSIGSSCLLCLALVTVCAVSLKAN
jgi:putative ABC transport system permease protein